jgi:hypothetical protein
VASIPGGIFNAVSAIGNLPEMLVTGNAKEYDVFGIPTKVDTQQFGTKLADLLNMPQPEEGEKIPMDMARAAAGWGAAGPILKAAGAIPKVVQMAGVSKPVLAATSAAAGVGAGDIAKESGASPAVQMVASILANIATGGAFKAGSYMINPAERGASAMAREAKEAASRLGSRFGLPERLTRNTQEFAEGVLPTAAMKYNDSIIADAETMARLRNKEAFFARDEANQRLVYEILKKKALGEPGALLQKDANFAPRTLLDELNARTSPMRDEAINIARQTGGYTGPLLSRVEELRTAPGTRYNAQLDPLIAPAERILSQENIDPLDLYSYRKQLADSLNNKAPMTLDEMTNAAKNSAREAKILKNSVDEGINAASGGKWEQYLAAHREGMKPINELEAWQDVLSRFNKASEIAPGTPRITPHALRTAIEGKTYSKSGRDLLSEDGRNLADQLKNTLTALERARSPRAAIDGSQTAPLLMQATKGLLANKPGMKNVVDIIKGMAGYFTGNNALDDAILNPEKLEKMLETAIKNKDDTFLRTLRDAVVRSSINGAK